MGPRTRKGRNRREGKNKEKGWTKASPSHMVQINRLNKRVRCGDEIVGVGVLSEQELSEREELKPEAGKLVAKANAITYGASR